MSIINEFSINPDYLFGKDDQMVRSDVRKPVTYSGMPQVVAVNATGNENVVYVPIKARAGRVNISVSMKCWLRDMRDMRDTDRAPCLGQGGMTDEYVALNSQG